MRYQYKRVCTRTVQGLRQAEMLRAHGWKMINTGFSSVIFEKEVGTRARLVAGSEAERVYKTGRF